MKKILAICLSLILMISMVACATSGTGSQKNDSKNTDVTQNDNKDDKQENSNSGDSDNNYNKVSQGKTLVAYYSATGSTKKAAQYIASATGGDLFELVPVTPYSDADLNWNDKNSRVSREHDNPGERNVALVADTVSNFAEYDTVFIGYPIWWGIAAWPVNNFIKANDFMAKTVVPFCTSASSGLGESGTLLKEAAGTGNWLEGKRFNLGVSESEVKDWVKTIN